MDAYYQRPEISNSDLSELKLYFSGIEFQCEPVEAYRFGRLVDLMITERDKVDFFKFIAGGERYTKEEFDIAYRMLISVRKDRFVGPLLNHFTGQKIFTVPGFNIFWGSFQFKVDGRCKYDLWADVFKWGCDIKSTTSTTQKQFEDAAWHFGYPQQRAWYMDLSGAEKDMLVGISKKNFEVFKIPIDRGSEFYLKGREMYSDMAFKWYCLFQDFNNN